MQESALHRSLKEFYSVTGCVQEARVEGFEVDVQCGEQIIEIQTGHFYQIKAKLNTLLPRYPVILVHPIAQEKWICRVEGEDVRSRRRSPRRGRFEDIYYELIGIPHLLAHPNLTLEIVFVQVEEIWKNDGRGSWRRRGWSIVERRLLGLGERFVIAGSQDLKQHLPDGLDEPFTVRELADKAEINPRLAYKMAYCLSETGVFQLAGKRGRAKLYSL